MSFKQYIASILLFSHALQWCVVQQDLLVINPQWATTKQSISVDQNSFTELEWEYLVDQIDRTCTPLGKQALKKLIKSPIHDINTLRARQEIIRLFAQDDELRKKMRTILQEVNDHYKTISTYWKKKDLRKKDEEGLYWHWMGPCNRFLNNSAIKLDIANAVDVAKMGTALFAVLGLRTVPTMILDTILRDPAQSIKDWTSTDSSSNIYPSSEKKTNEMTENPTIEKSTNETKKDGAKNAFFSALFLDSIWNQHDPRAKFTARFDELQKQIDEAGKQKLPTSDLLKQWTELGHEALSKGTLGDHVAQNIRAGYSAWGAWGLGFAHMITCDYILLRGVHTWGKQAIELFAIHRILLKRTCSVSHMIRAATRMRLLCKAAGIPSAEEILTLLDCSAHKLVDMRKLAYKPTFKNPDAFVYRAGNVLLMNRMIREHANTLRDSLLTGIGMLDALVAIAELLTSEPASAYSFAEYVDRELPYFDAQSLWSPFVSYESAVTNNVSFDGAIDPIKLIVTGPNGAGKSTIMKSVAWASLLAQTITIAPASSFIYAPCYGIMTALHPQENIKEGLSTFMAQKKRMTELQQWVSQQNANKPLLLLVDEPFSGTVENLASAKAVEFCRAIAEHANVALVVATHLEEPTQLAAELPNVFANYQVGIKRNGDGTFKRLFTFEPGSADWWFNDRTTRAQFVDWLEPDVATIAA